MLFRNTKSEANIHRPLSEINQKYIRKYKKRIEREIQNQDPGVFLEKENGVPQKNTENSANEDEGDLKYLSKLDSIDFSRRRNVK